MAELTPLDEKLGEVLGLAQAAQDATQKVAKLAEHEELVTRLERMREEAEAGELGHRQIVREMSAKIGDSATLELAEWAIPIQQRHKDVVRESSLALAAEDAVEA